MVLLVSCKKPKDNFEVIIPSPNGQLQLHFNLYNGEPYYLVYLDDEIIVSWSLLGFNNGNMAKSIPMEKNLQENLIITNTVPVTSEDYTNLISDEKYNSLKVSLQNKEDQKLKYEVLFLIYNEKIIFWYEYEKELKTLQTNLIEHTELDLSLKNKSWHLADTISMNDTLYTPVKFNSDLGIDLIFSEFNSKKNNGTYLLQREGSISEFLIAEKSLDVADIRTNQSTIVKTTKNSIHIYRNK